MLPEPLGVLAGTVVGVVFVIAGAAKLSSLTQWQRSARDMGVPRVLSPVVPWIEVILGGLVTARVGLPWSAFATTLLLGLFTAVILRRLLSGYRPGCGCFGERSPAPLGARHVVRNVVLTALSVCAVLG